VISEGRSVTMALTREELIVNLSILELAGPESKAAFQRLRNAYEMVREHFKQKDVSANDTSLVDDEVQRFFNDNFEW
jgi:hypothetical protein